MRSASGFLVALKGESELEVESSENFAGAARAGQRLLRATRNEIPGCARAGFDPFRHAAREHNPFLIAPVRSRRAGRPHDLLWLAQSKPLNGRLPPIAVRRRC